MVAAYHLIWTAYGWWLPNDPRGSLSLTIRQDLIAELGELHHGRKRIQLAGKVIRAFYDRARGLLKHELRTFVEEEFKLIASAFAEVIHERRYTCYACVIMPDHVHLAIRKHKDLAEDMIAHFQTASRELLLREKQRASDHPVWGGPGWKVFLDSREDIERTIRYILDNPIKIGKPVQNYDFVTEYDGWLPGMGPYRKR